MQEGHDYDTTGKDSYAVYATTMNYEFLKSIETGCGLPAGTLKVTGPTSGPLTSCAGAVAKLMGIAG